MIFPPSILRMRIADEGKKGINLWLPLFLLWPLLILVILIIPVLLIAALFIPKSSNARKYLLAGPDIIYAICAIRGLKVDVQDNKDKVYIVFW